MKTTEGEANRHGRATNEEAGQTAEHAIHGSRGGEFRNAEAIPTCVEGRFGEIASRGPEQDQKEKIPDESQAHARADMNRTTNRVQHHVPAQSSQNESQSVY